MRAPGRWERLFARLLPPAQRDAALGDAAEELAARTARVGPAAARRWYRRQVLRSVGPALRRSLGPRSSRQPRQAAPRRDGMLGRWIGDVRLAFRGLVRQPAWAATALVTLAIGIGSTTALFGVYQAVFLNPIALPDSGRIVFLMEQTGRGCCGPASGPDYADWVARQRAFSGLGALAPASVTLTGEGDAERVYATEASAGIFDLLEVPPRLGRTFTARDEVDGGVVILSYDLWQQRFGGREDVLGATLAVDQRPHTVVGVMPEGFDVPSPWRGTRHHQLYLPFEATHLADNRGNHSYPVVARVAPGMTVASAQADMDRVMADLATEYPATNTDRSVKVFTAHEYTFGNVGRELALILVAAGLVLLVACGNLAALQLARATGREAELAVRVALGATRGALMRLLLAESLVVAALGGAGGILVSFLAVNGLRAVLPASIPRIDEAQVNGWTMLFAFAAAGLTALAFGVLPSIVATRGGVAGRLGTRGGGATSPLRERLRDAFIVAQVALALMLANGAALLVRSYTVLRGEATGYHADGVLTMSVVPSGSRYEEDATVLNYYARLLEGVRAVPGAESVGTVSQLPLDGGTNGNVQIEGRPPRTNLDTGPLVEMTSITGDYFDAMGIALLRGRRLGPDDEQPGRRNVVINQHLAQEAWPGEDPLGKRFSFGSTPPRWLTVVGVVEDVRQWGPEEPAVGQAYVTLENGWSASGFVVVRTSGDPAALAEPVRRAVLAVDPTQAPSDVRTMTARVDRAFGQRRFYTTLVGLFSLAALLLSGAGVYGTVLYYVARRRRELGIRMALGASAPGIVAVVVGRGARLAAFGIAVGLAGIWATTSLLVRMLYGIGAFDPWMLLGSAAMLAAVAMAASLVPARRAVRVSPVVALRAD